MDQQNHALGGEHQVPERAGGGELVLASLPRRTREEVEGLVEMIAERSKAAAPERHLIAMLGRRGPEGAVRSRPVAIGRDVHTGQRLAVVRVHQLGRQASDLPWEASEAEHLLLRRGDGDSVYSHSIPEHVVEGAARRGQNVAKAAQDWLWDANARRVSRQGDYGLVPVQSPRGTPAISPVALRGNRELEADQIRWDGKSFYGLNPRLTDLHGVYPDVELTRWARLACIRGSSTWSFVGPVLS